MKTCKKFIFILIFFLAPLSSYANTSVLDFNFKDAQLENGFEKWLYVDKGENPCGVYNGHKTSKLCSIDNYRFYLYYNNYNSNHMGWTRYGFIDADSTYAISENSLKVTLTGGAFPDDAGGVQYFGKPIYSKSDLDSENDYGVSSEESLSAGGAALYFKGPSSTSRFPELQGKNRLTMWVLWPKSRDFVEDYQVSPTLSRPEITFSLYPFIGTSKGGHYYHNISNIPMGGWTKIQFDAHPQHYNGGDRNPYSAFSVGGYEHPGNGIDYFNNISALSFVANFHNTKGFPASINIDDIFSHLSLFENDETINNIAIGFDQQSKLFDIGFADKYRCTKCNAEYLIKYSFSPITQSNFEQAYTPLEVLNFNRKHNNDNGHITKPNPGYNNIWAAVKVQNQHMPLLIDGTTIYFAIKDISDRSNINQEAIDFAEQLVPTVGNVRTIDLIKTINYPIHIIDYPLVIESKKLPQAISGKYYSAQLQYSGGNPPYKVTTLSPLPEGLTIDVNGFISGIPSESSDTSISVKLTDDTDDEISKNISLEIKSLEDFNIAHCQGIVDFSAGKNNSDILYSTEFDQIISDKYTGTTSIGRTIVIGQNGGYNYQGVTSNNSVSFEPGDTIRGVWYNDSDKDITFTPMISFDDPDRRHSGTVGTWQQMTKVRLKPHQWGVSNFVIPHESPITLSLINISVNFNNHKTLVLDKIERISSTLNNSDICTLPFATAGEFIKPLFIHTTKFEPAIASHYYSTQIEVDGGTPPYKFDTSTELPQGISLNSQGVLSGATETLGNYDIELTLSDANNSQISSTLSFEVKSESDFNIPHCFEIVDFAAGDNNIDMISSAVFDKVISDKYTHNTTLGKTIGIGQNGGYNYQGVSGKGLNVKAGDIIRSVWFNDSENPITFTPFISFNDIDRRFSGKAGDWQMMTTTTIKSRRWNISNFTVPQELADIKTSININVNFDNHQTVILDKIEYINPDYSPEEICKMPFPKT